MEKGEEEMTVSKRGNHYETSVRGHGRTEKEAELWIRKHYQILPKNAVIKLKRVYQDKLFGFYEGMATWVS